jgi:L-ribulokinase
VASSRQAVACGAAIFGALAAGDRGFSSLPAAVASMTRPPRLRVSPEASTRAIYDELYQLYREAHDLFGRSHRHLMTRLRQLKHQQPRSV